MNPGSLYRYVSAPAPRYMLRLAVLRKLLRQHLPSTAFRALEIGPGLGDVSHFIADDPACQKMTLVDFSEDSIASLRTRFEARETPATVEILRSDLMGVQSEPVDVLFAFEVLEHIVEDQQAMDKLFSLLKAEGKLILSVPAYQRKWQKQDEYAGHVRRYERQELHDKLSASGFSEISITDYGFPLTAMMYPFKQASYKPDAEQSGQQKTEKSGVERPFFSRFSPHALLPLYLPFIGAQSLFLNRDLGDGFVAVARKP